MTGPEDTRDSERALGRLLAGRSRLSRPEHDAIAATVLAATAAESAAQQGSAPPRAWWLGGALGAAAAAALTVAVAMLPRAPGPSAPDPFTARGGEQGPQLALICEPDCRVGGSVVLEVAQSRQARYIALFSFRPDGVVVWYAPGDALAMSAALPRAGRGLLPFRIELDASHPPGRYAVVAVFSKTPLSRDAVRSAYRHRKGGVTIVERALEVVE